MEPQTVVNLTAVCSCGLGFFSAGVAWKWPARVWTQSLPAAAIGLSVAAAMSVLIGPDLKYFSPGSYQWIFWIALATSAVAGLEMLRIKTWMILFLGAGLITAGLTLVALGKFHTGRTAWTVQQGFGWIGLSAGIAILNMIVSHAVGSKVSSRAVLIGWAMSIGLGAIVVGLLGKSERMANLMLVLGSVGGGLGLLAMIVKDFKLPASASVALAGISIAIVSSTMDEWYAYLLLPYAILVMLAPSACLSAVLADRKNRWKPVVVVTITVIALLAWPLGLAYATFLEYRESGFVNLDHVLSVFGALVRSY